PAGSFERCYSLLALDLMSDPERVLAGMCLATRSGGVIGAAVWDFPPDPNTQHIFWDTAAALDPEVDRARDRHSSRSLVGPRQLAAALRNAMLRDVRTAALSTRMGFADFADYWKLAANDQGPIEDYINQLSPEQLDRLTAAVRQAYLADGI